MTKKGFFKDVVVKRLCEMSGSQKVKVALDLSAMVRKIHQDGQHTRRTA